MEIAISWHQSRPHKLFPCNIKTMISTIFMTCVYIRIFDMLTITDWLDAVYEASIISPEAAYYATALVGSVISPV